MSSGRSRSRSRSKKRRRTVRFAGNRASAIVANDWRPGMYNRYIIPGHTGLSNRQYFRLNYVARKTFAGVGSGLVGHSLWRTTSLYDPDYSGGGGTPFGYTALSAIYEKYIVTRCDYRILFQAIGENDALVSVRASDDTTTATTWEKGIQNGISSWKAVQVANDKATAMFSGSVYSHIIQGVPYNVYMSDDQYGAKFGASPADGVFLHLAYTAIGASTSCDLNCVIELVFYGYAYGSVTQS